MRMTDTTLFDYQVFCELIDHIQYLKLLSSQNKKNAAIYRKKIQQICDRVERDFSDSQHYFSDWVNSKTILLESGQKVSLNGDNKVIFVLLILNRRRELGLQIFQNDVNQFYILCKQSHVSFPKNHFASPQKKEREIDYFSINEDSDEPDEGLLYEELY